MIKHEDLRIGDLVRVCCDCEFPEGSVCIVTQINPERTYKKKTGVVTLSYADGTDDGPWGVWCCYIEGVPLTPEILEKNDFKRIDPGKYYTKTMGDTSRFLKRYIAIERKRRDWAVFLKYESLPDYVLIRHIQYVHELQHILWALGLDAQLTYPSIATLDIEAFQAQVEELDDVLSIRILEDLKENK